MRASAGDLWGRYRINAVSRTVLTESREKYVDVFPGFPGVEVSDVGQAFVRWVESMETGEVNQQWLLRVHVPPPDSPARAACAYVGVSSSIATPGPRRQIEERR